MYAARINGGSVENEFSTPANNKEKEREIRGERKKKREIEALSVPRRRLREFSSKFLNFRWQTTRRS